MGGQRWRTEEEWCVWGGGGWKPRDAGGDGG